MELAIDTSTDWAGLALSDEGNLVAELTWKPGKNHTTELFPNLENILKSASIDISSLTAVFVARGPGSYNGLRAGVSAAKGFALSLNIPLIGVGTMEIEAYPFIYTGLPVCPVHDAGRGEIAVAVYHSVDGWKCLEEEHLTTVEKMCEKTSEKTIFCGEIPQQAIEVILHSIADKAVIPGFTERLRRPGFLSYLRWKRLREGLCDNPAALQPIYLRQPPITQRKKKY